MRTLKRNTQKMYYATYVAGGEIIYKLDNLGNKIVSYVSPDGTIYYEVDGVTEPSYSEPIEFYGNIVMSGGEAEAAEFGLNLADYNAVLVVAKGMLPINEQSLIWHESTPNVDADGKALQDSADYSIVKVSPTINVDKYVLAKRVKNES